MANMKVTPSEYLKEYYLDQVDKYKRMLEGKNEYWQWKIEKILGIMKPENDDLILDLGCGIGTCSKECQKRGATTVGVDYSAIGIRIASKLSSGIQGGYFLCADAAQLPFKDDSFDKIVSSDLIEHLYPNQIRRVSFECFRVLKEGGFFLIHTTPAKIPNFINPFSPFTKKLILHKLRRYKLEDHNPQTLLNLARAMRKSGFKTKVWAKGVRIPLIHRLSKNSKTFSKLEKKLGALKVVQYFFGCNIFCLCRKRA